MEFEEDIDFIIGYLNQSKKMDYNPQKLVDILLFLCKEIKRINKEEK